MPRYRFNTLSLIPNEETWNRTLKIYKDKLDEKDKELAKYKRAFEIFKRFVEEGNYVDLEFGTFDGTVDISDEEIELLEELMKCEEDK